MPVVLDTRFARSVRGEWWRQRAHDLAKIQQQKKKKEKEEEVDIGVATSNAGHPLWRCTWPRKETSYR